MDGDKAYNNEFTDITKTIHYNCILLIYNYINRYQFCLAQNSPDKTIKMSYE